MATGSALVFVHEGQLKYEGFNTGIMYEENCKSHTSNFRIILTECSSRFRRASSLCKG